MRLHVLWLCRQMMQKRLLVLVVVVLLVARQVKQEKSGQNDCSEIKHLYESLLRRNTTSSQWLPTVTLIWMMRLPLFPRQPPHRMFHAKNLQSLDYSCFYGWLKGALLVSFRNMCTGNCFQPNVALCVHQIQRKVMLSFIYDKRSKNDVHLSGERWSKCNSLSTKPIVSATFYSVPNYVENDKKASQSAQSWNDIDSLDWFSYKTPFETFPIINFPSLCIMIDTMGSWVVTAYRYYWLPVYDKFAANPRKGRAPYCHWGRTESTLCPRGHS